MIPMFGSPSAKSHGSASTLTDITTTPAIISPMIRLFF